MIWSVMILTMVLAVVPQWWSEWGFRLSVILSLGANVVLGLLSRTRRRSASGWRAKVQLAVVFILWGAYQVAELATTSAIGSLSLCGSDASVEEKQVVAFWAPFLLLHLGGPDNLTAYALEDNKLSGRKWAEMAGHLFGVGYAIYNYTYSGGHSRVLFAASLIVFVVGAARYVERACALWKANLDNMQEDASSSSKKTPREEAGSSGCYSSSSTGTEDVKMVELKSRIERKLRRELGDGEALLLAQDLFPIWRHALVDSSVNPRSIRQRASEIILSLEWESMCKVVEMALSLIYEVLYTKAILAHTWRGWFYLIRFLSPPFIAFAALLFWLHRDKQQQQGDVVRGSFVRITYALLAIDFLLDLTWLLRALGSTWAYAYLLAQAPAWLRHQVICPRSWHCLHRLVVRLDPLRWLLCSYRTWSGTIGRYNLLHECTTTRRPGLARWLVSMAGDRPKEIRYLSKLPRDVKEVLFERVKTILLQAIKYDGEYERYSEKCYTMEDIRSSWGQKALSLDRMNIKQQLSKELPIFGKEFEEDVLSWHIATCIVLPYIRQQGIPAQSQRHAEAIEVMSEYMMFLVAVRREMLPGLVLHSQLEVTREALVEIWDEGKRTEVLSPEEKIMAAANDKEKLAMILRHISREKDDSAQKWVEIQGTEGTQLLANAVELFSLLAGDRENSVAPPPPVPELLEFVFNVWVDKLVYAGVRCNREVHAKQLSAGGDLTTVLWMLIQHAGPFRMGEGPSIYIKYPDAPKPEEPPKPPPPPKAELPPPPPPPSPPPTPSYPPVCLPYYPSWPCPWYPSWPCPCYPQCPPQHEKPGDECQTITPPPEEAREDEDEDSSDEE